MNKNSNKKEIKQKILSETKKLLSQHDIGKLKKKKFVTLAF